MPEPGSDEIEQLRTRLSHLIERAELGDESRELAAEALEELAVVVEELQAQNAELITSRADLEHERERYQRLFDTTPDGYVVTDSFGLMREVNATAVGTVGRPRDRLIGRPLASLIDEADRRAVYAQLGRLRHQRPGTPVTVNLRLDHDTGTVPVRLWGTVGVRGASGDTEIRWLIHDLGPDMATADLRDSEERLRTLFATAPIGIVLIDGDGAIVFANNHADDLLRRDPDDVALGSWLKTAHPDDRPAVQRALHAARHDGQPGRLRHRLLDIVGDVRWIDHSVQPFRTPAGSPAGSISILVDVTAEHLATTESSDFTDAVLDTVGALVVVLTPSGIIQRFNSACEALTGRPADTVIGQPLIDTLIPPEEQEQVRQLMARLATDPSPHSGEGDWMAADGTRRRVAWRSTVLTDDDGSVRAVIGTGLDVTETRRLQEQVAQTDRLESLGRLAAGIAHDFNNTLSTVQLRLDRLAQRARHSQNRADIDAARQTIEHTKGLIADLVSFGRQQPTSGQATDISGETRRLMAVLDELLGPEITIDLDLTDEPSTASIDPARFEQVLTNLALNAGDAMPDGGAMTITTTTETIAADDSSHRTGATPHLEPGTYVRLSVIDTGVGIDPADLPHVFDPYYTTKPPAKGTGLGLATTYGSITQAGGAISIDSSPGKGTMVTVWLPGSDAPLEPHADDRTALLVDDDPDMLQALAEEVQQLGYRPITAETAEQALEHRHATIDLLITDVQLPGMGGTELAAALEAAQPHLESIYITGADPAAIGEALPPQARLLTKPFTIDQLAEAVTAATTVKARRARMNG